LLLYEYVTFLYGDDPDIGVVFTDVSSPLSLYSDTVFVSDELFKQVFVIFILEFENVYSLWFSISPSTTSYDASTA